MSLWNIFAFVQTQGDIPKVVETLWFTYGRWGLGVFQSLDITSLENCSLVQQHSQLAAFTCLFPPFVCHINCIKTPTSLYPFFLLWCDLFYYSLCKWEKMHDICIYESSLFFVRWYHFSSNDIISFFMATWNAIVYRHHLFFLNSPTVRHLDWFWNLIMITSIMIEKHVRAFVLCPDILFVNNLT